MLSWIWYQESMELIFYCLPMLKVEKRPPTSKLSASQQETIHCIEVATFFLTQHLKDGPNRPYEGPFGGTMPSAPNF